MAITADDYLVQVELASTSNIAADSILNTFAVKALDGAAAFADITAAVDTFYAQLQDYLGQVLNSSANAHHVRVYHLTEPEPRPPVYVGRFTQGGTGTSLPSEVAVCTSLAAAMPAGARPARRRGRMFIGPLNTTASQVVGGYARPSATFQGVLALATQNLSIALEGDLWGLSVWSRADNTLFRVVRGWVDNEWDTQRRRGPEPTARVVWPI